MLVKSDVKNGIGSAIQFPKSLYLNITAGVLPHAGDWMYDVSSCTMADAKIVTYIVEVTVVSTDAVLTLQIMFTVKVNGKT